MQQAKGRSNKALRQFEKDFMVYFPELEQRPTRKGRPSYFWDVRT
jgi:hypothetical protein